MASNPMFDYSFIYYDKGLILFFDEYDRVVEIIVLFETFTHRMEIKRKEFVVKTEYKP